MEHVRPIELIQFAANELDEPHRAAVASHLDECTECRAAYESQSATWEVLGEWTPASPPPSLSPEFIEERLRDSTGSNSLLPFRNWRLMRTAAAIVLGVGVGHLAGRFQPHRPPAPAETAATLETEAAAALGADLLFQYSPAGLHSGLMNIPAESDVTGGES